MGFPAAVEYLFGAIWLTCVVSLPTRFALPSLARSAPGSAKAFRWWRVACAIASVALWAAVAAGGALLAAVTYSAEKYGSAAAKTLIATFVVGPLLTALLSWGLGVRSFYWRLTKESLDKALPSAVSATTTGQMRLRFNQEHRLLDQGGETARIALERIFGRATTEMQN